MGLNFRVNLPGPFTYTKRIGGRRRPRKRQSYAQDSSAVLGALLLWILVVLVATIYALVKYA